MKRNLTFAIIGLTIGLVCGFKAANYNYRSEIAANRNAGTIAAVNQGGAVNGGGAVSQAEVQRIIEKARQNPEDFAAQHAAADQFIQIERADGAIEFLNKAQQLRPNDPETLGELAEAHYLTQKFDEAIKWAKRALEVRPSYPLATFYLMASYVETRQNLDEAERLLAQLEALRPGDKTLGQVRQVLQQAKAESGRGTAKTTVQHGPDEPKPTGGRR
jgi:tetratricopeptide (TPR) repeat protein